MLVTLTSWTMDPQFTCEQAASVCYDSSPDRMAPAKILSACIKNGHQSVAEHANFTFRIEGISRTCLAQLTRHRLASFSVRSQRYCYEDEFDYVTPETIQKAPECLTLYKEFMRVTASVYKFLSEHGMPKEDARFVLPNACSTTLYMTVNLRELIHICNERLCSRAQWEIRYLVKEMRDCVIEVCPEAEKWLVPKCERDPAHPFCPEHQCCGRHKKLSEVYKDE